MDEIAAARARWTEQFMSDEQLLGDLPDDAARLLLDHTLARLDAAASQAAAVAALDMAAESLRTDALALAEQASATGDPEAFLRAAVEGVAESTHGATPQPAGEPDPPTQSGDTGADRPGAPGSTSDAQAAASAPPSAAAESEVEQEAPVARPAAAPAGGATDGPRDAEPVTAVPREDGGLRGLLSERRAPATSLWRRLRRRARFW